MRPGKAINTSPDLSASRKSIDDLVQRAVRGELDADALAAMSAELVQLALLAAAKRIFFDPVSNPLIARLSHLMLGRIEL